MNKIKCLKKVLLFSVLFLTVFGCKRKYPEGPLLTLFSSYERVDGLYTIEQLLVDGEDSTGWLKTNSGFFRVDITNGFNFSDTNRFTVQFTDSLKFSAKWDLNNERNQICFDALKYSWNDIRQIGPIAAGEDICWDILKLKRKVMWIKTKYRNKTYEVHFKDR